MPCQTDRQVDIKKDKFEQVATRPLVSHSQVKTEKLARLTERQREHPITELIPFANKLAVLVRAVTRYHRESRYTNPV